MEPDVVILDEKDRQRLLLALNCMRMVSNSTYILDQETRHDTKINELMCILDNALTGNEEKVVVFSQWERMTRLVKTELENRNIEYAYLHGGVPSHKRKQLIEDFHAHPNCRIFLSTDAGSVGLNLQCASLIVNLDLPWNPAVLEQRIGRIHRHGQKRTVNVINLVSRESIEQRMLDVLQFKSALFAGALDNGEDQIFMGESKFKQFMSSVEKMTNASETKPPVITDIEEESVTTQDPSQTTELFKTAETFLAQLADTFSSTQKTEQVISSLIKKNTETGKPCIQIPIENEQLVHTAVNMLASLLGGFKKK